MQLIDTNVLLRLFLEDDKRQAHAVQELFQKTFHDKKKLFVPDMAIAEIVWFLEKKEGLSSPVIATILRFALEDERMVFENQQRLLVATAFYEQHSVDFIDAYQAALVQEKGLEAVVSFDKDFSRLPVRWIKPGA